ncbi:hypothetical protein F5J12DRAFT_849759 [Pisolithus orientalis]|uniref:uncharacterized protein n=1 Tax=Pisolithus orientalis TaxID=936130 RepID=UPI002224EE25|nr:uncharacterized protein F5J12DRAFT_849759 [Pisolithus orientalis]KAI5998336.1 hypothetical protein F5J12DRAFT_849759 [Pisolithus orientalis]
MPVFVVRDTFGRFFEYLTHFSTGSLAFRAPHAMVQQHLNGTFSIVVAAELVVMSGFWWMRELLGRFVDISGSGAQILSSHFARYLLHSLVLSCLVLWHSEHPFFVDESLFHPLPHDLGFLCSRATFGLTGDSQDLEYPWDVGYVISLPGELLCFACFASFSF